MFILDIMLDVCMMMEWIFKSGYEMTNPTGALRICNDFQPLFLFNV